MVELTTRTADFGDSAVAVAVDGDSEAAWELVHYLAETLSDSAPSGVRGFIPTYDSLLIEFDCNRTDHATIQRAVETVAASLIGDTPARRTPRRFVVPVVYGGEYGPDLQMVASVLHLTEAEVVALHTERPLRLRCLGSPAGSPMLDGPRFPALVPRLTSPRTAVPAGSVAVAGRQAVISPVVSPGGWAVLGRTPRQLIDIESEPPSPYRPGDLVQFVSIAEAEWDAYIGNLRPVDA